MVDSRIHPETGAVLRRSTRRRKLSYKGVEDYFDLPGWWPADDGDGILHGEDLDVFDRAYDQLVAEAAKLPQGADIRRIRTKLKLSQRRASELLGGGPWAFQKYESGEVVVSRPMASLLLLLLLDRDPSLLKHLTRDRAA